MLLLMKNCRHFLEDITSKITGLKQSTLIALYEKQLLHNANKIINDNIMSTSFCPPPEG